MDDEPSEYIDFIAQYKDWIAVKRMGIRSNTKPEEVAFHLAAIRSAMERHDYIFLGIDTKQLDIVADRLTSGMKKNYQSLSAAVAKLSDAETKKSIDASCTNKELNKVAESYLLNKIITNLGFSARVSQEQLSRVFPDLKVKKPPGRKPKA